MSRDLFSAPEIECPACGRSECLWDERAWADPPRTAFNRFVARLLRRVMRARLRCRLCRTRFAAVHELPRVVVGYHGCPGDFARDLVAGRATRAQWQASCNDYDWLGEGVYFWEHAPARAWQWARERYGDRGAVVAAEIALGRCLDLGDTRYTDLLRQTYEATVNLYASAGLALPKNGGRQLKLRRLDRLIIDRATAAGELTAPRPVQTVRCPFEEGEPVFEGGMIRSQTHVQIAVRDKTCIRSPILMVNPSRRLT